MNESWIRALILASLFGTVLLVVDVLLETFVRSRRGRRAINLRLKLIGEGRTHGEVLSLLRRDDSLAGSLPAAFRGIAGRFDRLIGAAQLTWPRQRIIAAILVAPVALFLLLLLLLFAASGGYVSAGRLVLLALFSLIVGAVIPLMILQVRATRTRRKMVDQFPVALDVFVRGLRAGHPIAAALDLLTVELPDPIGSEFGIVVDEITYGAELRDALQAMADRWDLDDMRMFVVSLSVQSETGGNLAEILENLSRVIRERQSMMLKVRALSSEGRMTAIMLTALPILAFVALFIGNPGFYLDVADDPAFIPGIVFLVLLYAIGFYSIRRMIDLKV